MYKYHSHCNKNSEHRMENNESERGANEREQEDEYYIHTILFAAGTTLAVACLKRVIVILFIEQWRATIFLALNLVVLPILFSSIHWASSENQEGRNNAEPKVGKKKKRTACYRPSKPNKTCKECHNRKWKRKKSDELPEPEPEHFMADRESPKLAEEELNERVEAFIAMFRQHLVSDARKDAETALSRWKRRSPNLESVSKRFRVTNISMGV